MRRRIRSTLVAAVATVALVGTLAALSTPIQGRSTADGVAPGFEYAGFRK